MVGLDESDRIALEQRLKTQTGVGIDELQLPRVAGKRDDALLVLHDREDHEVDFRHGSELAATWPQAQLVATTGLGHRRILRDADALAAVTAFVREGVPAPASDLVREVDRQLSRS